MNNLEEDQESRISSLNDAAKLLRFYGKTNHTNRTNGWPYIFTYLVSAETIYHRKCLRLYLPSVHKCCFKGTLCSKTILSFFLSFCFLFPLQHSSKQFGCKRQGYALRSKTTTTTTMTTTTTTITMTMTTTSMINGKICISAKV